MHIVERDHQLGLDSQLVSIGTSASLVKSFASHSIHNRALCVVHPRPTSDSLLRIRLLHLSLITSDQKIVVGFLETLGPEMNTPCPVGMV